MGCYWLLVRSLLAPCLNSLMALGKLLTTNVHPLNPRVNDYLAKESFYSVVAAMGVYAPQGVKSVSGLL